MGRRNRIKSAANLYELVAESRHHIGLMGGNLVADKSCEMM